MTLYTVTKPLHKVFILKQLPGIYLFQIKGLQTKLPLSGLTSLTDLIEDEKHSPVIPLLAEVIDSFITLQVSTIKPQISVSLLTSSLHYPNFPCHSTLCWSHGFIHYSPGLSSRISIIQLLINSVLSKLETCSCVRQPFKKQCKLITNIPSFILFPRLSNLMLWLPHGLNIITFNAIKWSFTKERGRSSRN